MILGMHEILNVRTPVFVVLATKLIAAMKPSSPIDYKMTRSYRSTTVTGHNNRTRNIENWHEELLRE